MEKRTILIVEDIDMIADYMDLLLSKHGYHVSGIVTSGENAVETALASPPDLVLMDIKLEGMIDGIEAAEIIRSSHDIPVVFVSAYTESGMINRAMATGAVCYLIKPFKGKDLLCAVERALGNDDAGECAASPFTVNHPRFMNPT